MENINVLPYLASVKHSMCMYFVKSVHKNI